MQPPPPDLFSLPTITLMIAITFIMQAAAIAFNSRMVREYKGIGTVFLATVSLALGFMVILLGPGPVTGTVSNMLVLGGHALIYLAVCQFIGKPFNRFLLYGLAPAGIVGMLALSFLPRGLLPLITVTQAVGFPLDLAAAYELYRADKSRYKLGAHLTALPLLLYGSITIVRFLTGIFARQQVLPGPTPSNIFDVMSLYALSYLWTSGFILMISQRLQSDLNDLAMNDALTRVRNRRAMQGLLDFEMNRVQRDVKDFSIALLDIDHFKRINDTHGHDVGDQVLHWVAQTLQSALRVQDVVARWGGEEFLILLPGTSIEEAMEVMERIRAVMERSTVDHTAMPIKVTFSTGVANSFENRSVDQICKIADQALYVAKQTRNRIVSQDKVASAE